MKSRITTAAATARLLASLAAIAGVLAGCAVASDHRIPVQGAGVVVADRPLELEIDSQVSDVRVTVDASLSKPAVEVTAVDRGTKAALVHTISTETVRTWYTADLAVRDGRSVLRIVGSRPADVLERSFVTINVRVPSCDNIRVRNSGGVVVLRGISGGVRVENGLRAGGGGDIEVVMGGRMTGRVELTVTEGDIHLAMGPNASGRVEASTGDGPVDVTTRIGQLSDVRQSHGSWSGTVNGGTTPILLRSDRGRIYVGVASNPTGRSTGDDFY